MLDVKNWHANPQKFNHAYCQPKTGSTFHTDVGACMGVLMASDQHKIDTTDPLKEATIIALKRVIDPLLNLMADANVTVRELNQLVRETAVRKAAKRLIEECGRESKSRVAIATGLSRSEVARILASQDSLPAAHRGEHPARRVLAAWHEDPKFLTAGREPAVLPIFGRRRSFEKLVATYGKGHPVRAMLDELTRTDAVERLANQQVRANSRIPIVAGLTSDAISEVGERGGDLLEALVNNVRGKSIPLFEATAVVRDVNPAMVSVIRTEIIQKGTSFITGVNSLLNRSRKGVKRTIPDAVNSCRLGFTVYCFQDEHEFADDTLTEVGKGHRKNLRRAPRPVIKPGNRKFPGSVKSKS
jgi:Family of unknown function (DUF6502)